MSTPTIKTRLLIISDTHCAALKPRNPNVKWPQPPFIAPLPPADLLIFAGDMTTTGKPDQYHRCLDMLREIHAPVKLAIAGNHDLTLDSEYMHAHLGKYRLSPEAARLRVQEARDLWTAPGGRARREGVRLLDEGLHTVDLPNGARITVYASPYTPEYGDTGFAYRVDEDRFNAPSAGLSDARNIAEQPVPSFTGSEVPVDVLLTHGPPLGNLSQTISEQDAGCPHLLWALMRCRPLLHCFGHIHEGWGAEIVQWSEKADEITAASTSIAEWKAGAWEAGVAQEGRESISVDREEAEERHAAYLDVSRDGKGLHRGHETLLVNAAIMDMVNAQTQSSIGADASKAHLPGQNDGRREIGMYFEVSPTAHPSLYHDIASFPPLDLAAQRSPQQEKEQS
ncbi:hypothetical protein LTR12_014268 [Friedmanniomyces endolithicus]|nr:hypothetical protein LTR74_016572 [Friedmanniomyces endolithicus]KAK1811369.1 hypothetical protein LTR12_014268 [Friedmanniomyces endolithicus]